MHGNVLVFQQPLEDCPTCDAIQEAISQRGVHFTVERGAAFRIRSAASVRDTALPVD